jgi:magnesium chelatase family protein
MNPCPCGWLGHARIACRCAPERISGYRARVSGPLLDRIDMTIDVPAVAAQALDVAATPVADGEPSVAVAARVAAARQRQRERQGENNARLDVGGVARHCVPGRAAALLIAKAMTERMLSARAYHRVLRVARTIADLEGSASISDAHAGEAIGYRAFPAG